MSTHDELLATVIAHPDDDAPRLVYSDFLEEQGDEASVARAEFIRLQIVNARLPKSDPTRTDRLRREKELADQWAWEWARPLHEHITEWVFERGFIEKVSAYLQGNREEITSFLRLAPIRHIRNESQVTELSGIVSELPELSKLTGLEFWGLYCFDDESMRQILTSPHLQNLQTLILSHDAHGDMIPDEILIEALHSPFRSHLRNLAVSVDDAGRGPSEDVVQAMLQSQYLQNIERLNLSFTRFDPPKMAELFLAMPRLSQIDLHRCYASHRTWNLLLDRGRKGQLEWLRLCDARQTGAMGTILSQNSWYRPQFDLLPIQIDWTTERVLPNVAGCWRGYSWDDQYGKQ